MLGARPNRNAVSLPFLPSDSRVLALEDDVRDVFAVHQVHTQDGGRVVVFGGQFLRSPELVYGAVAERFRARGFVPVLRQSKGQDWLVAYPAPMAGGRPRLGVIVALFVLTVVSTILAGASQALGSLPGMAEPSSPGGTLQLLLSHWTAGVPFAAALLGILGAHEFGHYFTARRYRLDVSLPYFIPFPLNPLTGTLGAVIRIQSPFESRQALFDVGVAGPLAGLLVAIPITMLGLARAELVTIAPSSDTLIFNEPLLFRALAHLIVGPRPPGTDILMNPLLAAGWWGLFVTALNLVPISQLDGGHIAYALFGQHHRRMAWLIFGLAALVVVTRAPGYLLLLGLVFLMGVEHPPALNDLSPLGFGRRVLGVVMLALFLSLITIHPFSTG